MAHPMSEPWLDWQPIETVPEAEHVALFFPEGEKGIGGIECATVYRDDGNRIGLSFWTHGGPNSGTDWEPRNREKPTMWARIPWPRT